MNPKYYQLNCALLSLGGEKTASVLQNILTSDVGVLKPNQWQYSALCNHQGRVLSLFALLKKNDHSFFISVPESLKDLMSAELTKYGQFSNVTVSDDTANWQQLLVFDTEPLHSSDMLFFNNLIKEKPIVFCLQNTTTTNQVDLKVWKQNNNLEEIDQNAFHQKLIELGIAQIEKETSGEFIAQMIDLAAIGGLSFTKGCYIGQEVIARLHYRGRLTRKLQAVEINSNHLKANPTLKIGDELIDENGNKMGVLVQKSDSLAQVVSRIET